MTSNARKIADWRLANPNEQLTVPLLLEILGLETLCWASLCGANLTGASLCGANLGWADLTGTDLGWADLRGAYLPGYMPLKTPSGEGDIRATPDGWRVSIGCWEHKTLSDLKALIDDEVEWPEAAGVEREDRRPFLVAVAALMEAQAAYYPDLIDQLAEKWKTES